MSDHHLDDLCSGKRCYPTSRKAAAAINGLKKSKRRKVHGSQMAYRFYLCDRCGYWHLSGTTLDDTSKQRKRYRRKGRG